MSEPGWDEFHKKPWSQSVPALPAAMSSFGFYLIYEWDFCDPKNPKETKMRTPTQPGPTRIGSPTPPLPSW